MSAPAAALAPRPRLADRLNPILVKEVRQALRGRFFKVMFWLTLGISTLVGLLVVADAASSDSQREIGQQFFVAMFGCLSAAVHGFVPFSAYLSTSSEWDENTHDLLVLSNLGPRQIVLGKLLSALTQALLYYSTFGPFLVCAFLLNGIDLLPIGVLLVCSLVACTGLSLVGIATATLARARAARGILMAIFGAGLVMTWFLSVTAAEQISRSPQILRDPQGQVVLATFLAVVILIALLFATVAAARLAHEEENRSTGLRLLCTSIVLCAGLWSAWMHAYFGEEEFAWGAQVWIAFLLAPAYLFFLTEREALGRRTQKHVSAKGWLAWLSIPFLPGGGRAVLFLALQFALALSGALLALKTGAKNQGAAEVTVMVSVFYGYVFLFLALPAGIASARAQSERGRFLARVVIFFLVPFVILAPALVGLLLGVRSWMELEHPFNPVWVMDDLDKQFFPSVGAAGVGMLVLALTYVINRRRVHAGIREVLAASRVRRTGERTA